MFKIGKFKVTSLVLWKDLWTVKLHAQRRDRNLNVILCFKDGKLSSKTHVQRKEGEVRIILLDGRIYVPSCSKKDIQYDKVVLKNWEGNVIDVRRKGLLTAKSHI